MYKKYLESSVPNSEQNSDSTMLATSIRRFGLEYCDLATMLWNVAVMLRLYILNIDRSYKKKPGFFNYIFTFLCVGCYFYVYFVSNLYYIGWKYAETQDTVFALISLSVFTSSEIGNAKYFYMIFKRETLVDLIEDFQKFDNTVPPDSRMQRSILSTLKITKRRAIICWLVIMGNGLVYLVIPILTPGRHLPEDRARLLGLDPMLESPNYEIAFVALFFGVIQTCFVPANSTALFIVLVGYTEAQIIALTNEMLSLWDDAKIHLKETNPNLTDINGEDDDDDGNEYKITNDFVKRKLKELIERHGEIVVLKRRLEKVFTLVIGVEFILLTVALIFELLGGLENTYIYVPFAVMQVFMDCLAGQSLMDASVVFEQSVYSCKWENFDISNRRAVAIMLTCAQRELKLSAGGVTSLSFMSFMSIIRSVYSAYATLRRAVH